MGPVLLSFLVHSGHSQMATLLETAHVLMPLHLTPLQVPVENNEL